MKKALLVLALYDELNSSNGVNLDNFIKSNDISLSSFRRYINDINYYLAESYTGTEVNYDRQNKCYKITKYNGKY